MTTIKLCWADGADRSLPLPAYESAGAAGADLLLDASNALGSAP